MPKDSTTPPDFTEPDDPNAIVVALLTLAGMNENFHVAYNHSAKVWRFNSSWLDIELNNRSLRLLLDGAVEAVVKAKGRYE